jgi:hypothetical protein
VEAFKRGDFGERRTSTETQFPKPVRLFLVWKCGRIVSASLMRFPT